MYISDMVALLRETTWLKVISPNYKDDLRVTAATCKHQTCANGKGRMRDETCDHVISGLADLGFCFLVCDEIQFLS